MKNNANKLSALPDRDERLGEVLADGLNRMGIDGCPGTEEIAALVDDSLAVGGEKREKIMKHLASCADCYEVFLLSSDLQKEEEVKDVTEIKRKRINIISFKPLALAASLLIVIFSLYLFYKSDEVPKSAEQFFEMSKAKRERVVPVEEVLPKADFKDKKKEAKKAVLPPATSADKQPEPKLKAVRPSTPKKEAYREDARLEKIEKKGGEIARGEEEGKAEAEEETEAKTGEEFGADKSIDKRRSKADAVRVAEGTVSDEARDMKLSRTRPLGVKEKTPQMPRSQERGYVQPQPVVGGAKSQRHMQAKAATAFTEVNVWREMKGLELRGRSYKTHMPGQELQRLFKDTLNLTKQLQMAFKEDFGKEVKESERDDFSRISGYKKRLAPLITVVTVGEADYVFPNIDYFLKKSEPGSLEYRFFKLARSGWCGADGLCYGAVGNIAGRKDMDAGKDIGVSVGKDDKTLLAQWQALKPQLKGVFRQIAGHTINRLKQESR